MGEVIVLSIMFPLLVANTAILVKGVIEVEGSSIVWGLIGSFGALIAIIPLIVGG
jgi:hypothetical protein